MSKRFDRLSREAPEYLDRLRSKGSWRAYYATNYSHRLDASLLSRALLQLRLGDLDRSKFLDAGCGDSPDALLAVRFLGFRAAVKVDLFPIHRANSFTRQSLKLAEQNNVRFVRADVCDMRGKVATESITLIGCNAMIDLIAPEDRPLFYAEAWRVLMPGGILSISYVSLSPGYGWGDGWSEIRSMQNIGFEHINRGHYTSIVMQKPSKEQSNDKPTTNHQVPKGGAER